MSEKRVLVPGPDHPITITPAESAVTVRYADRLVASTERALVLQEANYPPVFYVPLEDVEPSVLQATAHETYCPYKGDASYYSLADGDALAENAVWTYRTPYDAVSAIAGHVAFYPHHVEITAA
ncbi:DUF427 domain-containing protein [Nocardioides cynanchi]|uniref:DUF427 domain-containing protein n=1 Tax=Nocardioides cynanchi TaxID=2558918 RepID=UPI00124861AD|nr:DUF427 domain-containing protein [Nocardioides cynanchi]